MEIIKGTLVLILGAAFFTALIAIGTRPVEVEVVGSAATSVPTGIDYYSYAANPSAAQIIHSWSPAGKAELCEVWSQGWDGKDSVYARFADLGVSAVGLWDTVTTVCRTVR
jgi:hypothetical protein